MSKLLPNILFIQVDQLTASMLGAYGSAVADTPNIDSLAEHGTVFDSAYTNFPLCAPSRFSMMSGQLASRIGAYDNGAEFPSSIPTFAHYLRALNYQTTLVGKMHFVGADQLHGFEERLTTDIYPADFNWTGDWTEAKPMHSNDPRTFTGAGICVRNVQMEYDEEVCHRAKRKIYDLAKNYASHANEEGASWDTRPFLLVASFSHPHDPYQCSKVHWDRYQHEDIDMPVVDSIAMEKMDPYSRRLMVQYGMESFSPTEEQVRIARHAYYGSVSYVDDQVGELLDVLKETGLEESTVVVFTTDHGDMLGERGMWYKKSFFEASSKIPLIIKTPGEQTRRVSQNVSLVDLLPTLLELGGDAQGELGVRVEPTDGESLCELMIGNATSWSDTVYGENTAEGAESPVLMVRHGSLKYIYSSIDPEQLFDLAHDPDERVNLIGNPDYFESHQSLVELASVRWDMESLIQDITLSQHRRLFLREALAKGKSSAWDYVAPDQVVGACLRGKSVYNEWAYNRVLGLEGPSK